MGLLSNPKVRSKIISFNNKYNNKLAVLFYLGGVGWFLALAYQPFNNKTYFSENALLPGLVEPEYYKDHGAVEFFRELKSEVKKQESKRKEQEQYQPPTSFFMDKFRELGLETYEQNFTFTYPLDIAKDQVFHGRNFYAILRAPRTASTESVILSAPYRLSAPSVTQTSAGIALMYGIARAFRRQTYWAKDIIFLVTDFEHIGMQAWLSAYHYAPMEMIKAGELPARSGSIQAAVNLEVPGDQISRFNIKLEGLNGQLPNLDLVNTVVRLCQREGVTATLQKRADPKRPEELQGFQHSLKTMLKMMWNQASGTPTGNHGLFHRYHIEAVTLQGVKIKHQRSFGFTEMGRVVEGVFRSLNNLLERFHQSFFFYLLPATERYVSIGLYMPPFGLLVSGALLKAIALWISAIAKEEDEKKKQLDNKTKQETEDKEEDSKADEKQAEEADKSKAETPTLPAASGLVSIIPTMIMCSFFGLAAYGAPYYAIESGRPFRMVPADGLTYGCIALLFSGIMFPRMLRRKATQKGDHSGADWYTLKCVALIIEGLMLFSTAAMNISLAFFIAALWVPVTLCVGPSHKRLWNLIQYILLLMISPLGMMYLACLAHNIMDSPNDPVLLHVVNSYETFQSALLTSVVDHYMLGNWTFGLLSLLVFPNWLMFWSLLWTNP